VTTTHMQDQLGRRIAARLTLATEELPHEVVERLRAGRAQALAKRQRVSTQLAPASVAVSGAQASLGGDEDGGSGWWRRVASVLPLLALAAGLIAISVVQNERRANELAEVDAALLTDALPPAAYTDPGFLQFLKSER